MLLEYSNDGEVEIEGDLNRLRGFIEDIYSFSRNYKKKAKRSKHSKPEKRKLMNLPKIDKISCFSDEDQNASEAYIDAEEEESFQLGTEKPAETISLSGSKILMPTPIRASTNANGAYGNQSLCFSGSLNVEYILNNVGVLQNAYMLSMSDFFKKSLSFSVCSDSGQAEGKTKEELHL